PQETVAKPKETVTPKPEAKERTGVPDESVVELKKFVSSSATKAGLDPEDATFTFFCNKAPTTYDDGDAMPFEDQVAWAIERTKNYQTFVQTESTERGKERQKKSLPLGRGTGELPPSKTKEFKPVTISDALDQVRQERTL
ncbi:MAG: hypothetical protein L7F78_18335, partial [Syntrophales bacterium LBB04]|nr:hypothetical protein [Syntrophales bacterium LBB04]